MKKEDLPVPAEQSAYMDNHGGIWLWSPDPPSSTGMWRLPGGVLSKAGNHVMDAFLRNLKITTLTRMAPVVRRKAR